MASIDKMTRKQLFEELAKFDIQPREKAKITELRTLLRNLVETQARKRGKQSRKIRPVPPVFEDEPEEESEEEYDDELELANAIRLEFERHNLDHRKFTDEELIRLSQFQL